MKKLSYSSLLIFCTVLSQGIATLLDQNIDESSAVHVRKKRVFNIGKKGVRSVNIKDVPYIVYIQKYNISECTRTILSAVFVLALYACVFPIPMYSETYTAYTILSGSAMRNHGTRHTIRRGITDGPNRRLALYEVSPHIDIHNNLDRPISLFLGVVPNPAYGIFSGWGCIQPGPLFHKCVYPVELMQARLFIIQLEECIRIYHERQTITDQNICTLDATKRRGTCVGDEGGPLVLRVPPLMAPHLLGVLLFRGITFGEDPDVFINLNHEAINQWITHKIYNHV